MASKIPPIASLIMLLCCFRLAAGEISVTGVKPDAADGPQAYEISINNAITIKDVKLVDAGGRRFLKFPEYVSQRKRVYPQVVFTTRAANEAVRNAVLGNVPGPARNRKTAFKIARFSLFNKRSKLKALATVSFNDILEIECKIIESKNGLWVGWPSKKLERSGEWFDQVVITDKKLKGTVEEGLLARYRSEIAKEAR